MAKQTECGAGSKEMRRVLGRMLLQVLFSLQLLQVVDEGSTTSNTR
jgi:hypothetical protein